jgi:hypothetical protein
MPIKIQLRLHSGEEIELSRCEENEIIERIVQEFCPAFAGRASPIWVRDAGGNCAYFDRPAVAALGVKIASQPVAPDVVVYDRSKNRLFLIDSATSRGPIDATRRAELSRTFAGSTAHLVFVTAFADTAAMAHCLSEIAWETEVWVAQNPSHMIHFNGGRIMEPNQ